MSKVIKSKLEEQLLKALANIESVVFSTDNFLINDITFDTTTYTDDTLRVGLEIQLEPTPQPLEMSSDNG